MADRSPTGSPGSAVPVVAVVLIAAFSGFCSLIYQVVWDRTIRYNFGGDSVSSAVVTGTFLLGLGLGAYAFGRWRRRAFATYALVEVGIGAFAIVSFYYLAPLATILGSVFSNSIEDVEGLRWVVVSASILFLVGPCVLMGGTLPLMFNCFIAPGRYSSGTVGIIYGANTVGASIGIGAAPFLFLNHFSIPATLFAVGFANVLFGVGLFVFGRHRVSGDPAQPPAGQPHWSFPRLLLLALSFVSGFVVLSFEIGLFRAFALWNPSSPYTFPTVLMPILLSLAAGSFVFTRFRDYSGPTSLRRIGFLFVGSAIGMLAGVVLAAGLAYGGAPVSFNDWRQGYFFLYWVALTVPVPFLAGGVFPLLLRLASGTGEELPERTGRIYLANAIGAFSGALATQFVGFPFLGARGVIWLLFLVSIVAGLTCLVRVMPARRYRLVGAAAALAAMPFLVPSQLWNVHALGTRAPNLEAVEGVTGVATIERSADGSRGEVKVNGQLMSALPDDRKHMRLASFALAFDRRARVLVLGLGGGSTVRELVEDAGVDRVDVVDWSYELPRLLQMPWPSDAIRNALDEPNVRVFRCDARVAVSLYDDGAFDVIVDNLGRGDWVGATSIKSSEYYAQINRLLGPLGVFIYDANYSTDSQRLSNLAALTANFDYVYEHESRLVLASDQPIAITPENADRALYSRAAAIGITGTPSAWMLDGLRRIMPRDLDSASPIRDDLLIHEFNRHPLRVLIAH